MSFFKQHVAGTTSWPPRQDTSAGAMPSLHQVQGTVVDVCGLKPKRQRVVLMAAIQLVGSMIRWQGAQYVMVSQCEDLYTSLLFLHVAITEQPRQRLLPVKSSP